MPCRSSSLLLEVFATGVLFLAPTTNLHAGTQVPFISVELARVLFERKQAVFMDVRGKASYEAEHIQGAMLFPLTALQEGKTPPLPVSTPIIVYCGCPHGLSEEAAEILLRKGFQSVYVLDEGFYGWKEKGYPIATNPKKLENFKEWRLRGIAPGVPEGTKLFVTHLPSGQMESFLVGKEGRFEFFFPLYGARQGDPLRFQWEGKRAEHPLEEDHKPLVLRFSSHP